MTACADYKASGAPAALIRLMQLHEKLAELNRMRLVPQMCDGDCFEQLDREVELRRLELGWLQSEHDRIAPIVRDVPRDTNGFIEWFEELKQTGPGQGDPLFPFLAETASLDQLKWFLRQEVAGEAGFEDLVALTQLRMPEQAKLELARNYWDEMGRGHAGGMHGPMLARLAADLRLANLSDPIVTESTALGNLLAGFAANRRYAYHSIGALGVVELTAPGRAELVNRGLKRVGISPDVRQYYALHATLDIKHSEAWNRDVLHPLVAANGELAPLIAAGALLRLDAGARCFERYRSMLLEGQRLAA